MAELHVTLHSGEHHALQVEDDFDFSGIKPSIDGWVEYGGKDTILRLHQGNIASVLLMRGQIAQSRATS